MTDERVTEDDGPVGGSDDRSGEATESGGPWSRVVVVIAALVVVGAVAAAVLGRADPGAPPAISVTDARAGERVGTTLAVYLTLSNEGGPDTLVAAGSPDAARVQVHGTDEVGMMRASSELDVPAGADVRLEPGGTHLMLEGVGRSLAVGDTVPIELEFDRSGSVTVDAQVVPLESLVEDRPG